MLIRCLLWTSLGVAFRLFAVKALRERIAAIYIGHPPSFRADRRLRRKSTRWAHTGITQAPSGRGQAHGAAGATSSVVIVPRPSRDAGRSLLGADHLGRRFHVDARWQTRHQRWSARIWCWRASDPD